MIYYCCSTCTDTNYCAANATPHMSLSWKISAEAHTQTLDSFIFIFSPFAANLALDCVRVHQSSFTEAILFNYIHSFVPLPMAISSLDEANGYLTN